MGALLGFTWKSVMPWCSLWDNSAPKKKRWAQHRSMTQILVETPWSNLIRPSLFGHRWAFIKTTISDCENYLLHLKSKLHHETHTDTHFHNIKYALGELAIGLGRRSAASGKEFGSSPCPAVHTHIISHLRTFELILCAVRYTMLQGCNVKGWCSRADLAAKQRSSLP